MLKCLLPFLRDVNTLSPLSAHDPVAGQREHHFMMQDFKPTPIFRVGVERT